MNRKSAAFGVLDKMKFAFSDLFKYITINEASEEAFLEQEKHSPCSTARTSRVSTRKESYWRINNHNHNKLVHFCKIGLVENKKTSNSFLFGLHSWVVLGCNTGVAALIMSRPRDQKKSGFRRLGSLSTRVFERRTATGRKHFACLDPLVTQIFILLISDKQKIPRNVNVVVMRAS